VTSTQTELPSLRFVIVNYQGNVSIHPTLVEALADVFGEELPEQDGEPAPPGEEEPPEPEGTIEEQVNTLLEEIAGLYADADAALAAGDLGAYDEAMDDIRDRFERLEDLYETAGSEEEPTDTTSTTEPTSA
jgi:uncharacterized membrane protein (UPF0182 family)